MIARHLERVRLHWAYRTAGIEGVARYLERAPSDWIVPALRRVQGGIGHGTYDQEQLLIDNDYTDRNSTGDFRHLTTGKNCYLGKNVILDLAAPLTLGDEIILAAGCTLLTHQDCGDRRMGLYYPRRTGPVAIGDGSWI